MQRRLMYVWRVGSFPLMVALGFLPIPLLLTSFFAPEFLSYAWIWPICYVLLEGLSIGIRGKWRVLYGLGELAVLAILAVWMASRATHWSVFAIPVMYAAFLLIELPRSPEGKLAQNHLLVYEIMGIGAHVIAQLIGYSTQVRGDPVLDGAAPWFTVSFFGFILLALVLRNENALSYVSSGRLLVSTVMKRKNLLLTLALFGAALGVACIPAAVSIMKAVILWGVSALQWVIGMFASLFHLNGMAGGGPSDSSSPALPFEGEQQSAASQWSSAVITVIALVLVAALACFALYWLGKKLIVLARELYRKLSRYFHAVSEDYVDEITDTREDNDRSTYRGRQQKKLSGKDMRKLPPDQRIRYRYWLLMRKHARWAPGSTARENLNTAAASIYERVRYSKYAASEADDQRFAEETKTI